MYMQMMLKKKTMSKTKRKTRTAKRTNRLWLYNVLKKHTLTEREREVKGREGGATLNRK